MRSFMKGVSVLVLGFYVLPLPAAGEESTVRVKFLTGKHGVRVYWGSDALARRELAGINYQPTEDSKPIHYYTEGPGSMTELLAPLLAAKDPVLRELGMIRRGQDHARLLTQETGAHVLRLYYLPPGDSKDVQGVIKILNRGYELYGLRVVLMHWAGLWNIPGAPELRENTPKQQAAVAASVRQWVKTYGRLKGLLYFILGNENDYHVRGGPHTWRVLPMDFEVYITFMSELAVAAKEAESEIGTEHPILFGCGAGTLLSPENKYANRSEIRVFDGLAVNFYGGRKPSDGPIEAIRRLFLIGKTMHLPIFISETGKWAMTPGDPAAADYRDRLLPYLREADNLVGVTWFEATDEGWKRGEDPKFNDDLIESHYGILGKVLQKDLFTEKGLERDIRL